MENLVYRLDNKIYVNLTNHCTNDCIFCLRSQKDDVCGKDLILESEDFNVCDVTDQLQQEMSLVGDDFKNEIIFCGYGEPMLKLEILKEVASFIKKNYKDVKTRINTNGTANLVYKRNVVPELVGLIDTISVSLNAQDETLYNELSQPKLKNTYSEVKNFIKAVGDSKINAVATIVTGYKSYNVDVEKCEQIAKELNATIRVREWIENGYS